MADTPEATDHTPDDTKKVCGECAREWIDSMALTEVDGEVIILCRVDNRHIPENQQCRFPTKFEPKEK